MLTFFAKLELGIPSEFSTTESRQNVERILSSGITQMIHQLFPQFANVELTLALTYKIQQAPIVDSALIAKGNNTAH